MSIKSFILSKCASTSSSGFPANSGLKHYQFNCGKCCIGCTGQGDLELQVVVLVVQVVVVLVGLEEQEQLEVLAVLLLTCLFILCVLVNIP